MAMQLMKKICSIYSTTNFRKIWLSQEDSFLIFLLSTTNFGSKFWSIIDWDYPRYSVDASLILFRQSRLKINGNILSAHFCKNLKTTPLLQGLKDIFSKSLSHHLKKDKKNRLMMMEKNLLHLLKPIFSK